MQPIIRRTITITVTETWTITWPDGHETAWPATREAVKPANPAPGQARPALTADDDGFELDAADLSVDED